MANPLMVKGNKLAVGNSGGKSWQDRLKRIIEKKEEEITDNTLKKLANIPIIRKLVEMVENEDTSKEDLKDYALPITLKGMSDKHAVDLKYEKAIFDLTDNDEDKNIQTSNESNIGAAEVQSNSGRTSGS